MHGLYAQVNYYGNKEFIGHVILPGYYVMPTSGHVTVGGSICMELLTRSGWLSTNDIEGILIQIRSEIMSDPRARLAPSPDTQYSEEEAKAAFERMVLKYGWNRQKR